MPAVEAGVDGAGWATLICGYLWDCQEALGVVYGNARCPNGESSGNPGEVYAGNYGLWQIDEATWRPYFGEERWARVLDAAENTAMAWEIYERNGWVAWACHP